jgi:uncharacterized protein YlxW (UPF0749 family)
VADDASRRDDDHAPEARGRHPWRFLVPVITLLAGFLCTASGITAHGGDLRSGSRTRVTDLIIAQQRDYRETRAAYLRLRGQVDALSSGAATRDGRVRTARRDAQLRAAAAGFTPAHGHGIRVTLDDAPHKPGRTLPGNPGPDDLVVHQQDVQAVVNALWAGGATAMQIMDQRVISTSAVRCVGNTLILQGVVYSPPFRITATGDPRSLRAALNAAPAINIYRQYVAAYGLGYDVSNLDQVTIPAYTGAAPLPVSGGSRDPSDTPRPR